MITKDFIFEFDRSFHDDNANPETVEFFFTVTWDETVKDGDEFTSDDDWCDFTSEMEEYGVHDFACSPEVEIGGFHSYEIRVENEQTVLEKWHKYFTDHGFVCGPITQR